MKLVKLLSLFLMLILSTKTVFGQCILRNPSGEIVLNKSQEDKILQALEDKTILYLEIEARDNEINYLNNKLMESFRLTQSLMDSNEKLKDKVLSLSKKVDNQNFEIGKLQRDLEIKTNRLRAFQIATVVTSTIIVLKFFVM
jgi:hypothetical protein